MSTRVRRIIDQRSSLRSYGVVTWAELERAGWTRWRMREAVRSGALVRVDRGLFLDERPETDEGRWLQRLAAAAARAPGAALSGPSAARLHGLDEFDRDTTVSLTVAGDRNLLLGAAVVDRLVRTRGALPTVRVGPFLATDAVRTLLDLGAGLPARARWDGDRSPIPPFDRLELALESALRSPLVTIAALEEAARVSRIPGAAVLRAVLARRSRGVPPTESYLETRAVQMMRVAGLPDPQRQVTIRDRTGRFVARVDFLLGGVVIECDGRETHDNKQAFENDRRRWTQLQRLGYRPLVFTSQQIEQAPAECAADIRATCALSA